VRRIVLVLAAMAAVLAPLSACGDDGEAETGASTTTAPDLTTTSPPTTAEPTPEEQVEAAYLEFVEVVYRLVATSPDPDDAELARLATDPVLGDIRDSLATMAAENHIIERGPRSSHRVMSVAVSAPDTATLSDCSVGNDTTIDQDGGSVVSNGLETRVLEVTVLLLDGTWTVSEIATLQLFDGEVSCPS
jgi:hypothetical protein